MFQEPPRRRRDPMLVVTLVALGLGYASALLGWLHTLD
jgi:hypothetical protein